MMHNDIKTIVELVLKDVMGKKKDKIEKIMASIDDRPDGILVYLSHGATLGEACEIQDMIKKTGLQIPEQMGNALTYVTKGLPSYERAIQLLRACMSNIEQWNDCRNELTLGEFEDIGFDDNEIEQFGFAYVLDAREDDGK